MAQAIPTPAEIRQSLEALSYAEVKALCERCEVPFTTVWKLRTGETKEPRLDTVRAIWQTLKTKAKQKVEA